MKFIITDLRHDNTEEEEKVFAANGLAFRREHCMTEDELISRCADGQYWLNQYGRITRKVMEALPDLKFIVRYGVGFDNVDIAAATDLGIQVCNVPDYGMNEVANHAFTLLMTLWHRIIPMVRQTKTLKWDYLEAIPIRRMHESTIGVIGLGRIGSNFARKMNGFGCKIVGYDINDTVFSDPTLAFIEKVTFDDLLSRSDAVAVFVPLDNARNLIDLDALKKMKPTAYLINTSRGGIVNETDLNEALTNKIIAGAGFDVMGTEPPDLSNPLFSHDNFLITPHMAWYSEESSLELKRKAAEEAVSYALHRTCRYPVNHPKKPR